MRTLLIYLLAFGISQVSGQATVDWYNYPNGVSVATDVSNNVYTAYWDYNPAGDITVTKRNSSGVVLWNVKYDNTDNTRHEVATWVETDNSGNVLVSGTIRSGYSNPVNAASVLMKFSPAGALLWRVVYESSFDGSSTRKCLVDASNNIYVLGIGTGPNGQVTKVKKFNASGATVWNYFDAGNGAPLNFKFSADNKILISHRSITGIINGYSKIDLNGNNVWNAPGLTSNITGDAAGDASGNTYIVSGATGGSFLRKLSPTGATLWTRTNSFNASKVEVGTDNNPVIGGYPAATFGVVFMKYDSNGNLLWQNLDADGPSLSLLALTHMRIDASNAVYIAGSTMSAMGMCKVNSNGVFQWAVTTPSGYPAWFDFGTDGNVYITGGTTARVLQQAVATCAVPTGLSTSNVGPTGATFNWAAVSGASGYNTRYRIIGSPNWITLTVSAPATSAIITGLVSFSNYEWQVQAACQTTSAFSASVNFTTVCTTVPATISGSTVLCAGTAGNVLSANTGTGLTYQWKLNGADITGATNPTFTAATPGSYSCQVSTSCSFAISNTLVLTSLPIPATPGAIGGQKNNLCGAVTKTFTVNPVNAATNYTWTVPAGAIINSGQGTTSISVAFPASFISGTISVKASNSCGSSAARSATVKGAPATPGTITGSASVCANQVFSYSIAAVSGATSYTWTAPTGATIQSGQGTNAVTIRFATTPGYVRVKANNNCGSSANRSLTVAITCREVFAKQQLKAEINIFPNPTNSAFKLLVNDPENEYYDVKITDLTGRVVMSFAKIQMGSEFVFGERLTPGVYFAQVWVDEKPVTIKLIKL